MTDNEIIKALGNLTYGGHSCGKCKHQVEKGDERCGIKGCNIARNALDLINRQQAEIEKKSKAVVKAAQEVVDLKIKAKQQQAEIERLQKDKADIISAEEYRINQAKEFAYKEFAERLKSLQIGLEISGESLYYIPIDCIDNLLAELTPTTLNKIPHNSLCETDTYEGSVEQE